MTAGRTFVLLPLLGLAACTRAGFGETAPADLAPVGERRDAKKADDGHHPLTDHWRSDGKLLAQVTKVNDSCKTPYVLNMAGHSSASLVMDFTGAANDQNLSCCFGAPDLVVKVIGAPPRIGVSCSGGGSFVVGSDTTTCPATEDSCFAGSCGPSNSFSVNTSGVIYLVVCRGALAPITLHLISL